MQENQMKLKGQKNEMIIKLKNKIDEKMETRNLPR